MRTLTKELQDATTPEQALEQLKEGNKRFVNNQMENRNLLQQASETALGQYPSAVILSCIDSRTSAELIFDQGIGDIFSIRIAGNVLNEDILGSMEFGCKAAGSKLIVVMGHSLCGAVKGACDHVELGNLTTLLSKIAPAVEEEKSETNNRSSANGEFVEKVTHINIRRAVEGIAQGSTILNDMIKAGEIGVIGAYHDVKTGEVTFLEDTLQLG